MWPKIAKNLLACLRPGGARIDEDRMRWSRELGNHFAGEFSFAVVQGNIVLEDHSQVETAPHALFVGVYDGHAGSQAAGFLRDNLFLNLINRVGEQGTMSEVIIKNAFATTEGDFLSLVADNIRTSPTMGTVGSCCLVGIIWEQTLYVASLGDSRAVIGHEDDTSNKIVAEQLSGDHNARFPEVREQLRIMHPDDPEIVVRRNGAWRVKGIIQVTRSIGDAYLKKTEFSTNAAYATRFHLSEPLTRPALSAEPTLHTQVLGPGDKFIIFASDGLWEHMTNQQAVDIVFNNPRTGIARRLLRSALKQAAKNLGMTYDQVRHTQQHRRRAIHDDITVIVIFIDHELLGNNIPVPELSIRGFIDVDETSQFHILQRN